MTHDLHGKSSTKKVAVAIAAACAFYAVLAAVGLPQHWAAQVAAQAEHGSGGDEHPSDSEASAHSAEGEEEHETHGRVAPPSFFTVAPFVLLLASIAVFPLIRKMQHWWESNLHRFYVAAGLGLVTLLYYLFLHGHPIASHWPAHGVAEPSEGGPNWGLAWAVFANAMLHEYIPFIVLLFSLYTISGGIRIEGDLKAHPLTNVAFIGIGGLLASFIGTTGAAMVLIRPLLETNKERKYVAHTVVFFIFIVCNCGGCLLPIGDPPLFLGYLRGVPFLWTLTLWREWLLVNGTLLLIYWIWDHYYSYPHEAVRDIARDEALVRGLRFRGLGLNGTLLVGVILAVAFLDPSKILPGTNWHPWMYLREVVQLALVGVSLVAGSEAVRAENKFNFHAIVEVAALFCGIFLTMQPALQILSVVGGDLGLNTPMRFFWVTGGLSSVLDNAPTYVVFFETAKTVAYPGDTLVAGVPEHFLEAISFGAVFMGAMTYIGNGPNFMVKAIAEASGIRMPSFFGYIVYSGLILLPVLLATTILFFWALP